MLPSPAFVQSREFWFSPIDSIVCMRRFNPTDGCGTLYPWLLSITKRVETFSLLQGSHLCVVLWLHLFKILCNFDACCIFFQWLSLKGLGSVQQIGHTATVPLSLQCGLASSSVIDFHCLPSQYPSSLFQRCSSSGRIFMNLKIISCEFECKCTVIHSVYMKNYQESSLLLPWYSIGLLC